MNRIYRLLPIIALTASAIWLTPRASDLFHNTVDAAKVFMTSMELSRLAQLIAQHGEPYGCDLEDEEALADFVQGFLTSQPGGKPPTHDLWDAPYQFACGHQDNFVVFSTGPNGSTDDCAVSNEDWGQILGTITSSRSKPDTDILQSAAGPHSPNDDICASQAWASASDEPF